MERVLLGMSGGVAIAAAGLESAHRPDSQDICFVPDGDYMAFLRRFGAPVGEPGDFVDAHGHVLGCRRGLPATPRASAVTWASARPAPVRGGQGSGEKSGGAVRRRHRFRRRCQRGGGVMGI